MNAKQMRTSVTTPIRAGQHHATLLRLRCRRVAVAAACFSSPASSLLLPRLPLLGCGVFFFVAATAAVTSAAAFPSVLLLRRRPT